MSCEKNEALKLEVRKQLLGLRLVYRALSKPLAGTVAHVYKPLSYIHNYRSQLRYQTTSQSLGDLTITQTSIDSNFSWHEASEPELPGGLLLEGLLAF